MPIPLSNCPEPTTHRRSEGSVQTIVLALIALASVAGLLFLVLGGTNRATPNEQRATAHLRELSPGTAQRAITEPHTSTASPEDDLAAGTPTDIDVAKPSVVASESNSRGAAESASSTRFADTGSGAADREDSRFARMNRARGASTNSARGNLNLAPGANSESAESDIEGSSNDGRSNAALAPFGSDIWDRIVSIDGRPIQDFRDIAEAYRGKGTNEEFVLEYRDASGAIISETVPLQFCCNDAPPASR